MHTTHLTESHDVEDRLGAFLTEDDYEQYQDTQKTIEECQRMVEIWGKDLCQVMRKKNGSVDVKINWRHFKR